MEFTEVKTDKKTSAIAYGITSLTQEKADPKTILKFTRRHWGIENSLHHGLVDQRIFTSSLSQT
jgi:predicted transposase YbfD/YdcC